MRAVVVAAFVLFAALGYLALPARPAPVACEDMLKDLRAAVAAATLDPAVKQQVQDLEQKGIERCNADDDKRADDFFAQAMQLSASDRRAGAAAVAMSEPKMLYNRVPKVTLDFWLIKLLAVTMGETAADYLAVNLGLGLTATSLIMTAVLVVALILQFRQKRYVPWAYWLAVVLISIVGTLVTDNLVDNLGVTLQTTTVVFSVILAAVFAAWYAVERTLSIHTIFTTRRESFYWLAILFTFALGTSAGDLVAEQFELGYLRHRRDFRRDHRLHRRSPTTCSSSTRSSPSGSPTS